MLQRRRGATQVVLAALVMLAALRTLGYRAPDAVPTAAATTTTRSTLTTMTTTATTSGLRVQRDDAFPGETRNRFLAVHSTGSPATWQEALLAMQEDEGFQDALSASVREAPWEAIFFETRPTSGATAAADPFEYVIVQSKGLESVREADMYTFGEQLDEANAAALPAATFDNLGGDARLVVPTVPATLAEAPDALRHVGPYFRAAAESPDSTRALWRAIGLATSARINAKAPSAPTWLSTSGLGVYYLHFRIDDRPKYYTHAPFKVFDPAKK